MRLFKAELYKLIKSMRRCVANEINKAFEQKTSQVLSGHLFIPSTSWYIIIYMFW